MATTEVMSQNGPGVSIDLTQEPSTKRKRHAATPLIDSVGDDANLSKASFDANKHLVYSPPPKTYTMSDLGLPENTGISTVAVSEPFPLFSEDAIKQMRAEVLSPEVWEHCKYSSNLAQCQLRGFAPE